jgi:predicted Zn-dependent protease
VTLSRIADSRGRAEKCRYRQFTDSIEYHLTRERLLYLANKRKPGERVGEAAANLKSGKYRNEFAARYAYVLALTANSEFVAAREQISELLRRDRERAHYFVAQAQIEISAGKQQRAIEVLRHALLLYPHDSPLTFLLCDTLMDSGDIQQAHTILVSQGRYETGNPAYYQLLANSAERLKLSDEAHEAWAEYHYLFGRLPLAIEHLRTALRQPEINFYAKSRLEARLRELETESSASPGSRAGDIV